MLHINTLVFPLFVIDMVALAVSEWRHFGKSLTEDVTLHFIPEVLDLVGGMRAHRHIKTVVQFLQSEAFRFDNKEQD